MIRPLTAAQAPGRLVTGIFSSLQILTRSSPGSEMPGVPASVINAMLLPSLSFSASLCAFSIRLYSW